MTLLGTTDDWRSIRRRVEALAELELSWWTDALLPVLDQLTAAASGSVDVTFWRSFYKPNDASGGPYICGWITTLFPYLVVENEAGRASVVRNAGVARWVNGLSATMGGGPTSSQFPLGLSSAPFTWRYLEKSFAMEFLGGFVGVSQDPESLAVRPAIGWAVRDMPNRAEVPAFAEHG